jgi:CO/xanthine dehydrogenase Mo-binding subunit
MAALLFTPVAAGAEPAVERARKALADELGIAPDGIRVQTATAMEWPDSSLGCPRKGVQYSPAVTSGHRVVLEASGRTYAVHVAGAQAVICQGGSIAEPRAATAARLLQMARRDLASRLKIDPDAVKTTFPRPQNWPDASLGCPRRGVTYAQVVTPGFIIELEAGGKKYRYHSDLQRIVSCDEP